MRYLIIVLSLFLITCGGGGGGSPTESGGGGSSNPPTGVQILSVVYDLTKMTISWSASSDLNFAKYNLYHSPTIMGDKQIIYTPNDKTVTEYQTTDFNPGLYNWFFIEEENIQGLKTMSVGKSNDIDPKPTKINFNDIDWNGGQLVFSWDKSPDADFKSYTIYKAGDETMYAKSAIWTSNNIDDSNYYFSTDCGSTFYYTIEVEDAWGLKTESDNFKADSYYSVENTFTIGSGISKGYDIFETPDGGMLIVGIETGSVGLFTLKLDENGRKESHQTYGGYEFGNINPTDDGGYIISGSYSDSHEIDVYLVKVDSNGNEEWSNTYDGNGGEDRGTNATQTNDGGFIVHAYGDKNEDGSDGRRTYLYKVDSSGQLQWEEPTNWNGRTKALLIYEDSNQSYELLTGGFGRGGARLKFDSNGGLLSSEQYPTLCSSCYIEDIILNHNQEYLMAVWYPKIWSIKIDQDLNFQWKIEYVIGDESDSYQAMGISQTSDNGYLLIGRQRNNSDSSNRDLLLIKTDSEGNQEWLKTYDYSSTDIGYAVKETSNGDYIVVGSTGNDIYLIKIDSNGVIKTYCN